MANVEIYRNISYIFYMFAIQMIVIDRFTQAEYDKPRVIDEILQIRQNC